MKKRISNYKIISSVINNPKHLCTYSFKISEAKTDWLKGEIGKFTNINGNINILLFIIDTPDKKYQRIIFEKQN